MRMPSGTDIVDEIERAMARSVSADIRQLSQKPRVVEFYDQQRMKIEQGQWSPLSFQVDRMKLTLLSEWRKAEPAARDELMQGISSMGARIAHAEDMKPFWAQVKEVGAMVRDALPRPPVDFTQRLRQRQASLETSPSPPQAAPRKLR